MSRGLKGLEERWPHLYWTSRGPSVFVGYEPSVSSGRYGSIELGPEQITVERVGSGRWLARDVSGPHKMCLWPDRRASCGGSDSG